MDPNAEKGSELKEKGNVAFKEGRWDEALALFSAAIELEPTNHVFFANRSAASINLKHYSRALNDARKAIDLKPDWPRGYQREGTALYLTERFEEALRSLKSGLDHAPSDASLLSLKLKTEMALRVGKLSSGAWAEVPIAFSKESPNPIDFDSINTVIDVMINKSVTGLTAGSEMSEISQLTNAELLEFVEKVVIRCQDRKIPVIAGAPLRPNVVDLVGITQNLAAKGVVGVLIDVVCFGKASDPEASMIENLKAFFALLNEEHKIDIMIGLLESKGRKVSPTMMKALVGLGIVGFVVESSGSGVAFQEKMNALGDFKHSLKVFNSNSTTYLASLNMGGSGFMGPQASFAPRLYAWLWRHFKSHPDEAELMVAMLSISEPTFRKYSPINLKLFYRMHGGIDSLEPVSRISQAPDDLEESAMRLGHLAAAIKYAEDFLESEGKRKKDMSVLL